MHATFRKRSAFTFVELVIVILIMAVLAVALAMAYQRVQLKVRYDAHVEAINDFFQRSRAYSLTTIMIDETEPTEYYLLEVGNHSLTIVAEGDTLSEELDSYDFDDDISFDNEMEIYYFPPSGETCLGVHRCNDPTYPGVIRTEYTSTLSDDSSTYTTEFYVSQPGALLEITPLTP